MNDSNNKFFAPLSKEIWDSYKILIALIAKLPSCQYERKEISGTGGKVSVRDIVAYQIGWGKLLVGWYESGLLGISPEMPGEGFISWDYANIALFFYQKYQLKDLNIQLSELKKLVENVITIVEKEYKTSYLDRLNVWSWCTLKSGKSWPLSKWIRVNTVAPYKRASVLFRKQLRELQS